MSLRNKKLFAGFVGATLSIALIAGVGSTASAGALTSAQVSAIISLLQSFGADQATISNVQASLTGGTPSSSGSGSMSTGYTFTRDLKQGDTGTDVMNLQKVLNMDSATQVASSGAGSPGNETSTFGPATKAAVIKFQNKYASETLTPIGLSSGTGYVGAMTRAKLNSMNGGTSMGGNGSTNTPPPATGTGVTVSDPGQPGVSLAPQSAARLPFTKVRLTAGSDGDVTVNSLTIERTGLAQDVVFSGVVLIDENGIQIGDAKTFNSNHQATIGVPFTIKSGTSRTLTIAGNMGSSLSNYAGQVATLTVVSVNTNGAVVSGALPITGAAQTINATLSLGSANLIASSFDPNTASTKEIGTTAYRFSGVRLTAGSAEKVRIWSVRWYQSGSAASGDLANIQTYVDGVAYPTTVSSDGKYYTSLFPGGILIDKGSSSDVWVAGDLVGASSANRTVEFDLYKTTDVYLTGETYGYGVTPTASGNCNTAATTGTEFIYSSAACAGTASTPWFSGSVVTINAGSATSITKSSSVAAQNIAVGVPNQVLGGFETNFKGEPVSIQQIIFNVSTTTGSTAPTNMLPSLLTNVTIVDQNGAVVAGPVDMSGGAGTASTLTFTDTITFPVGTRVYTIKGKVSTSAPGNTVIFLSSTPSAQWTNATGLTSGNTVSLSANGVFSLNAMTIKAGSLTVTIASTPSSQTIVAGGTARELANYQFDATQSGEDVRLSSFKGQLTFATGAANELSGCLIYDGSAPLNAGTVVNPASADPTGTEYAFTFDNSLTIPKGTVKTLTLKCNLSTGATNNATFAWGIANTAANIIPTGVTSGSTIVESVTAATGPIMTIGSGTLAFSTDASSPSYTLVAGGTTGQIVGVYKVRATNESVNLTDLGLSLTNSASSSAKDLVRVTVWDGATQVGSATFTGTNTTATSTLRDSSPTGVMVAKDVDKVLTVKADLANIGNSESATSSGHFLAVNYTNGLGTGVESGGTKEASGSTSVAGIRIFKSIPTFAQESSPQQVLSSTGVGDGRLLRFRVTANSKGPVGLTRFEFTLSTTTASVTDFNLYAYTDSAYSQPVSGIGNSGQVQNSHACPSGTGCTNGPTIAIYAQTTAGATTTIQVPAGSTYYFEARASVSGSASGASVITTLKGDSAYPSIPSGNLAFSPVAYTMSSTTRIDLVEGQNSLIWTPNSTTTSAVTDVDWTNGYGVYGLPSSGIIQNRGN